MDEVNFVQGSNTEDYTKSKIMKTYRSVKRRMQSRFMKNGILQAKLFLVSSKKSEQDFVESYVETVKNEPTAMIIDEPQWNVKPEGTFSKYRFKVAVGDRRIRSRIVQDGEDLDGLIKQGYRIIDVPLELKKDFERDVDSSLMEFAGISSALSTKFISYENLVKAYGSNKNPFTNNIISIGINDDMLIQDFFVPTFIDDKLKSKPMYIHLDQSLTGDRTGISGVSVIGIRETKDYDPNTGEFIPIQELIYKHAFSIGILCPSGSEISLEKNRKFIYYLKYSLGFNIQGVSLDGYQSADAKQQLLQAGFNASIISLDRTPDGYMYLKASINERRISVLNIPELENELLDIERNNSTGKIDHTKAGCFSGDTKVALIDENNNYNEITFKDLTNNYDKYKNHRTISVDNYGNTILSEFKSPRVTKQVTELLELELDNGEIIKCTSDHRFLCKANNNYIYVKAEDLTEEYDIVEGFDNIKDLVKYLKSMKFRNYQICTIIKSYIIDLYINKGFSLGEVAYDTGVSKTYLNRYFTDLNLKRNLSQAHDNANKHNKYYGYITLMKEDKEFAKSVREKAIESLRNHYKNLTDEERQELSRRSKSHVTQATREKCRKNAIKKWNDGVFDNCLNNNNRGYGIHQIYKSIKFNQVLSLKSKTEKLFVLYCESVEKYTDLEYESIRIKYDRDNDGIIRTYIPDFLIYENSIPKYLVEVKHRETYSEGINKAKYEAGVKYCEEHNLIYKWITYKEIINLIHNEEVLE